MKLQHLLILTTAASCGAVLADVPTKAPLGKYAPLWTNSPFTSRPPPPPPPEQSNPLDDYVLLGVSPIGNGYRVTLLDRNNPDTRITVEPGHKEFEILSVTRRAGDPLGTIVRVATGGVEGDVAFDDSLLTVNPPPAAPAQQPSRGDPRGSRGGPPAVPGQPDAGAQPEARAPRRRVVPTAPGTAPGTPQPSSRPSTSDRGAPAATGTSSRTLPQNWQDRRSRGR
jgi:hypothetical protein